MSGIAPAVGNVALREEPVLDTVRVLGALAVLTTHVAFWAGAYPEYPLLARLDVGVAIFFVLSGFLLSRPWFEAATSGRQRPPIGRYLQRRFLRVFPAYAVTAVLALAFIRDNADLGATDWLTTLLLLDIYVSGGPPAGLTQMWSLATEVAFYLALPMLMLLTIGKGALRSRRALSALAAYALLAPAWVILAPRLPLPADLPLYEWLPALLIWFAAGMYLALAQTRSTAGDHPSAASPSRVRLILASPGVSWTLVLAIMLVASTPVAGPTMLAAPTPAEIVTKVLLYSAVGFLVVGSGIFPDRDSRYVRLMSLPRLRHLGHISYGIFLIHLPVLHLVVWISGYELFTGAFWALWCSTIALSVVGAELLYRLVERPAMGLRSSPTPRTSVDAKPDSATMTR
ncbi:acyltransferase family protein [Nocardioides coralli]|uniref:acyltransferase family protein n=1 Tax=Nocardioides coralli TaxID=2872154 RepID=UPI001CA452AF|nr:acyltransferase [Nocardioides coralli]QZY27901.1 acyltransferase [Nocardioides coralli]